MKDKLYDLIIIGGGQGALACGYFLSRTGNYDFGIGRSSDDFGCAYKTDDEKENNKVSIAYTNEIIKDNQRAYLRTLPAHIRLDFQINDKPLSVLLIHGSPRRINEY